jgi:hypothetical protein
MIYASLSKSVQHPIRLIGTNDLFSQIFLRLNLKVMDEKTWRVTSDVLEYIRPVCGHREIIVVVNE